MLLNTSSDSQPEKITHAGTMIAKLLKSLQHIRVRVHKGLDHHGGSGGNFTIDIGISESRLFFGKVNGRTSESST